MEMKKEKDIFSLQKIICLHKLLHFIRFFLRMGSYSKVEPKGDSIIFRLLTLLLNTSPKSKLTSVSKIIENLFKSHLRR